MDNYLDVLNTAQREAVCHTSGPLLILAGAGSGKTRVITTKIAWLIREKNISPESILALTFTNKAAREMSERASGIEPLAARTMIRTFHSFGAWFLRRNSEHPVHSLSSRFVIYDDEDASALLSTIREDLPRKKARQVYNRISRAKDYFYSPEDPLLQEIDPTDEFREIYRQYEQRLRQIGNADFGDLIKLPVEILREDQALRARYRQRFKFILVDEYQDSNVAQFELLRELTGSQTLLCVVGDDDQSIYRFRGAEVRNILDFPNLVQGTKVIRLEENYRSVQPILTAAESVVSRNEGRLGKHMTAVRGKGVLPVLAFVGDQDEEARYCAELVLQSKRPLSDWAILYRTNAQSLAFEAEFVRRKIPYKVVGSLKFYEREEIKDALALAAFVSNPRDEVAFRRIINKPTRGIGPKAQDNIVLRALSYAGEDLGNLERAIGDAAVRFSAKARAGADEFLKTIERGRNILAGTCELPDQAKDVLLRYGDGLSAFIASLALDSGIAAYHHSDDEVAGTQRLSNLQELVNAASLYESNPDGLALFLEHIELDRAEQADDLAQSVTLITIHNTKGLEFPRVIMTGVEQGIFPRDDKTDDDLEEERRLFYVGSTRAKDELYYTSCSFRRIYGRSQLSMPSMFLYELPADGIRVIGRRPYGFAFTTAAKKPDSEHWPEGSRLYHDDYGYGVIIGSEKIGEDTRLIAQFESGAKISFDPLRQKNSFVKMGKNA